jgi:hypothetical protein
MECLENQRMLEDETPEPERHEEHHEAHAARDAEQAGKSFQDARAGAGRGQHDIAGAWRDGGDDGEENKRHDLLRSRTIPPRIGRPPQGLSQECERCVSKKSDRPARVLNDRARGRSRAGS